MSLRLGIDVGGVIIDRANERFDTSFLSDNYLTSNACAGAFAAIQCLVRLFGPKNVFIVSKCGENVERKTREWLAHHRFFEVSGMLSENLRFCRQRSDKAPICRTLNITHFIDDRSDVLGFMREIVPHRFLFGPQPQPVMEETLIPVLNWGEVLDKIGVSGFADRHDEET